MPIPPLRERDQDVLLLAGHFLELNRARLGLRSMRLSPAAERAMLAYPWPGNVRELRNLVEQAVLFVSGASIGPADLLLPRSPEARPAELPAPGVVAPVDLRGSALERVEREMLVQALTLTGGNVSRAARELGISRDTLRYRMEKYGIGAATTGL